MEVRTKSDTAAFRLISRVFGVVFVALGLLNLLLVHPVPGVFYLLLTVLYFPAATSVLEQRLGLTIPFGIRITVGLVVLWGTLAVGDLAEMAGL